MPIGFSDFSYPCRDWDGPCSLLPWVSSAASLSAFVVALMRVSTSTSLRRPAIAWIGLFQGTPLLMQLFVAYFGLPLIGLDLRCLGRRRDRADRPRQRLSGRDLARRDRSRAARARPRPPMRSASTTRSRMVDVIMPQAFKLSLPATVGFLVQLLKGTSLAAIVGFIELTRAGTDRVEPDLPAPCLSSGWLARSISRCAGRCRSGAAGWKCAWPARIVAAGAAAPTRPDHNRRPT